MDWSLKKGIFSMKNDFFIWKPLIETAKWYILIGIIPKLISAGLKPTKTILYFVKQYCSTRYRTIIIIFLFSCRPNTAVYWSILRAFRSKRGHTRLLRVHLFRLILYVTEFENINLDFKYGDETLLPVSHWYIR